MSDTAWMTGRCPNVVRPSITTHRREVKICEQVFGEEWWFHEDTLHLLLIPKIQEVKGINQNAVYIKAGVPPRKGTGGYLQDLRSRAVKEAVQHYQGGQFDGGMEVVT